MDARTSRRWSPFSSRHGGPRLTLRRPPPDGEQHTGMGFGEVATGVLGLIDVDLRVPNLQQQIGQPGIAGSSRGAGGGIETRHSLHCHNMTVVRERYGRPAVHPRGGHRSGSSWRWIKPGGSPGPWDGAIVLGSGRFITKTP